MTCDAVTLTRLEKAAHDNGFDLQQESTDGWLIFRSSHCPLCVWLNTVGNGIFAVGLSSQSVAKSVIVLGRSSNTELPKGSNALLTVPDLTSLYTILKRAFQLSRALPNEPLNEFRKRIRGIPETTEAERTVIQRIGQNLFRERLLDYWDGKCAVTGLQVPELLRASHIKSWSDCSSDAERLDVFNGLLLAPHLDLSFDQGFITFDELGSIECSKSLDENSRLLLGITPRLRISGLTGGHKSYLIWHRERVFRK